MTDGNCIGRLIKDTWVGCMSIAVDIIPWTPWSDEKVIKFTNYQLCDVKNEAQKRESKNFMDDSEMNVIECQIVIRIVQIIHFIFAYTQTLFILVHIHW